MKIQWSKTKYILPLIILPFLFLLNYGYQSLSSKESVVEEEKEVGIRSIGDVSEEVQKKGLTDKLQAFKDRYRRVSDGETAIGSLQPEANDTITYTFQEREKQLMDSINQTLEFEAQPQTSVNYPGNRMAAADIQPAHSHERNWEQELAPQDPFLPSPKLPEEEMSSKYDDPMVLFREQMAIIDSMSRANDHLYGQNDSTTNIALVIDQQAKPEPLPVSKTAPAKAKFNTIRAEENQTMIKAIVDEELKKASVGDRVRIRVLDDIIAGNTTIPKNSYLFATISGFQDQRVKIDISTIMVNDRILPVNLKIYDMDGMEGLYVPSSDFRDFTKELGSNSSGGMNLRLQHDPSSFSQFYMSSLQRMFTSTSQALSKAVKQNRANLKYGTLIYLVDPEKSN